MKNKFLFFLIIGGILTILLLVIVYFVFWNKNNFYMANTTETQDKSVQDKDVSQNKLVTDDFEITLTDGWIKTQASAGTLAMAVATDENTLDSGAKKINFRSYLAVSRDTFSGDSLIEYMQTVKDALLATAPNAVFYNENELQIKNRKAYAMEVEINQQEVNFKVLIVAVKGDGDDVWVMSFNTTKLDWEKYSQNFSDMANSFFVKIK